MKISSKALWDEKLKEGKRKKLASRLAKGQDLKRVSVILRIRQDPNLLHILSAHEMKRLKKRALDVVIVGVAKDYEAAIALVAPIIMASLTTDNSITGATIDKEFDITWPS